MGQKASLWHRQAEAGKHEKMWEEIESEVADVGSDISKIRSPELMFVEILHEIRSILANACLPAD